MADASQAAVVGLKGLRYLDSLQGRREVTEGEEEVRFQGEVSWERSFLVFFLSFIWMGEG